MSGKKQHKSDQLVKTGVRDRRRLRLWGYLGVGTLLGDIAERDSIGPKELCMV